MRMKNPLPIQGYRCGHDCLEPLGRQAMNNLVSGKAGISAEMGIRLEKAFGGGAETWLRTQATYNLAQAEKRGGKIEVRRVKDALIPV